MCVCIYKYTHIIMYTSVRGGMYVCIYIYIYIYTHTYTCMYMHAHAYVTFRVYKCVYSIHGHLGVSIGQGTKDRNRFPRRCAEGFRVGRVGNSHVPFGCYIGFRV